MELGPHPEETKCKHVAFCEEVYPKSEPTTRSHPEPSNPCAFNDPTNHMSGPRTAVNVLPQVTGTATPVSVCPQVAGATTLFSDSPHPQGAKLLVPSTPAKFIPQGAFAATPAEFIPQGAFAATPAKVSPQGAFAATPAKVSPQGYRSNEEPVCLCTAGKCKKLRIGKEDWYVCPIPKGKGACSHKVLVSDFAKDTVVPSAQATPPGGELHPESPPSMLHYNRPTVAVSTPSKSPMMMPPYYGTPGPISSPNPNDICFRCNEKGHWGRDCPKNQSPRDGGCFTCGMVGHWARDCPQRQRYGKGL